MPPVPVQRPVTTPVGPLDSRVGPAVIPRVGPAWSHGVGKHALSHRGRMRGVRSVKRHVFPVDEAFTLPPRGISQCVGVKSHEGAPLGNPTRPVVQPDGNRLAGDVPRRDLDRRREEGSIVHVVPQFGSHRGGPNGDQTTDQQARPNPSKVRAVNRRVVVRQTNVLSLSPRGRMPPILRLMRRIARRGNHVLARVARRTGWPRRGLLGVLFEHRFKSWRAKANEVEPTPILPTPPPMELLGHPC